MQATRITGTVLHGGDLADATGALDGDQAPNEDWLDLSTGINPSAYPLPEFSSADWTRLPGRHALVSLLNAVRACYAAPDVANLTAGPGSQAIIQALPGILPALPVTLVAPIYGGHAPAWQDAGSAVAEAGTLKDCNPAAITILVNPNNPDGRITPGDQLAGFADAATGKGGWLVVDEAFGDLDPSLSAAGFCADRNVVVLKSFGKFFGLAGVRLGFAIAPVAVAALLTRRLGSWAVSGPALRIGEKALTDRVWQENQRNALEAAANRLDDILTSHGLSVSGGTSLFRLVTNANAQDVFAHLLRRRIYVRRFPDQPSWLRVGMPGDKAEWQRLDAALLECPA